MNEVMKDMKAEDTKKETFSSQTHCKKRTNNEESKNANDLKDMLI